MYSDGITPQIYLLSKQKLTYIIVVMIQTQKNTFYLPNQLNGRLWDENVSKTILIGCTLYNYMELFFKMEVTKT